MMSYWIKVGPLFLVIGALVRREYIGRRERYTQRDRNRDRDRRREPEIETDREMIETATASLLL